MQVPTLTRPDGQKSTSFTMVVVSFGVCILWLLASIVHKIGPLEIRPFSGSEAAMFLTPILALYFGRRQTEASALAMPAAVEPATPSNGDANPPTVL